MLGMIKMRCVEIYLSCPCKLGKIVQVTQNFQKVVVIELGKTMIEKTFEDTI